MRKTRYTVLTVVLLAGLAVGLTGTVRQLLDYRTGDTDYSQARTLAGLPSATPAGETQALPEPDRQEETDPVLTRLAEVDLDGLREVNPDVVAWLEIPGTEVSYPVLQGDNNTYYLNHTWRGNASSVGAIFLETKVSADFSDFNTIVYGHRMNNSSMFGCLKAYWDQDFLEEHRNIYVVTDTGARRYEVFAAWEPGIKEAPYQLKLEKTAHKQAFLDSCLEHSVVHTGVTPDVDDSVLTLSTCTGSGNYQYRRVVQAVLR